MRVDFAVRCLTDFKYYQYIWVDESHVVRSWRSARAQTCLTRAAPPLQRVITRQDRSQNITHCAFEPS